MSHSVSLDAPTELPVGTFFKAYDALMQHVFTITTTSRVRLYRPRDPPKWTIYDVAATLSRELSSDGTPLLSDEELLETLLLTSEMIKGQQLDADALVRLFAGEQPSEALRRLQTTDTSDNPLLTGKKLAKTHDGGVRVTAKSDASETSVILYYTFEPGLSKEALDGYTFGGWPSYLPVIEPSGWTEPGTDAMEDISCE